MQQDKYIDNKAELFAKAKMDFYMRNGLANRNANSLQHAQIQETVNGIA